MDTIDISDGGSDLEMVEAEPADIRGDENELQEVDERLEEVEQMLEQFVREQQQLQARRAFLLQKIESDSRAPKADWAGTFAWDCQAELILRNMFHLQTFRPQQREVINATMQGRDVLCLLPSGGGKSLCYQLPALLSAGCTIVISPLLSLIQDQVDHLQKGGIVATSLTSLTSKETVATVYKTIESDEDLRLVYVTPERILKSNRLLSVMGKLYKAGRLKRIAIDECHCCSSWGNDFRPDYKKLGILKQQFPDVPILALTATATHKVRKDIQEILRIPGSEVFRSSVNRPNLHYLVRWKPPKIEEVVEDMLGWVAAECQARASGIVYCLTRKDTMAVAELINSSGKATAAHYHADMDPLLRQQVHERWSTGEVQIMVATIAFGMGINKTDVRFVIHHSLSKSIENYYQESGRAGRDGLPAKCLLYYRPADMLRQAALVCTEPGWESHLFAMVAYAQNSCTCYRSQLSGHFSEEAPDCRGTCQVCDASQPDPKQRDIRKEAQAVVSVLARVNSAEKRLTLNQLLQAWGASKDAEVQALAKAGSKDDNERVIGTLVQAGVLSLDFGFTAYGANVYLKRSQLGMQGGRPLLMAEGTSDALPLKKIPVESGKLGQRARKTTPSPSQKEGTNGSQFIAEWPVEESQPKKRRRMPSFMTQGKH